MYCVKCGKEVKEGQLECENCESDINPVVSSRVSYDYKSVGANQKTIYEIIDCYEALGWELVDKTESSMSGGISLSFRRNRKVKNKDRLNRLQLKLDDAICGIGVLEKKKTKKASAVSIIVGIAGVLTFGGGMCLCMLTPLPVIPSYILGVALAAAGAGVCLLAGAVYKKIRRKSTVSMNTLIDKKRDEISVLCEDAHNLLVSN